MRRLLLALAVLLAPLASDAAVLATSTGTPLLLAGHLITPGTPAATGVGATSIAGVELPADQVYQTTALGGPTAQVAVSAAYTGTAGTMQACVLPYGGGTETACQALAASGGTASGNVAFPRSGTGLTLRIKDVASGASWTASQRFLVGDVIIAEGQSNMRGLQRGGATYEHSHPLIRRNSGAAGWSPISNDGSEVPMPSTPPTVYAGMGLFAQQEIPGDPDNGRTTASAMTWLTRGIVNVTGSPVGLRSYSVIGSEASTWDPFSGTNWSTAMGLFTKLPGLDASIILYYQGENSASSGQIGDYKAVLPAMYTAWKNKFGRDASSLRFGVVSLGPSGGNNNTYGTPGYFGQVRAAALAFVAATPGAFLAGSGADLATQDGVHLDGPSADRLGKRIAVASTRALGRTVIGTTGVYTTGAGPRVTSVARSGNVITLTVGDMDGATALVMGDGSTSGAALAGIRVWSGPASGVAVSGAAVGNITPVSTAISGSSIVITLPAGTSYPVSIDHQMADAPYGMPPVAAGIVYGNNTVPGDTLGLPLQPLATTTVN